MLVTRNDQLRDWVHKLRDAGSFAIDTEFERERTYWPKLQLVQVGVNGDQAALDPLALDMEPLYELVADPKIEKIMHAGRQDAEIFFHKSGIPPAGVYDTQVAAALVGLGEQIGYANLAQRLLKVRIKKTERVTDWGRRPLSPQQLEYALDDVRYLGEIKNLLHSQLEKLERTRWLNEELAFYNRPDFYEAAPRRLWSRISGWRSLNRRGLGILRELAVWREKEAQRRDVPRNRVTGDDVLLEVASRRAESVDDLVPLRRLHPRERERSGHALVECVKRGLELPESELPQSPPPPSDRPELELVADLMSIVLKQRAREHSIAPSYLGTSKDLGRLTRWLAGDIRDSDEQPALLSGWRRELVGNELEAVFRGERRLNVDPEKQSIEISRPQDS